MKTCLLFVVCCWGDDGDGVEELMTYKVFPLSTIIDATMCSEEYDVQVSVVIDGFVFLSVKNDMYTECILSLCLEIESVNELIGHTLDDCDIHPYIMAWPPSLVGNEVSPCFKMLVKFLPTFGPCIVCM